jgi:predicted nucleic acid-binding protein
VEAWNVMTRPATQNGFGFLPQEAFEAHREIETIFSRLPGTLDTHSTWRNLVLRYSVRGVQVHDARLVAAMLAHGIRHILTLDTKDFRRYASEGIVVVDPRDLVEA